MADNGGYLENRCYTADGRPGKRHPCFHRHDLLGRRGARPAGRQGGRSRLSRAYRLLAPAAALNKVPGCPRSRRWLLCSARHFYRATSAKIAMPSESSDNTVVPMQKASSRWCLLSATSSSSTVFLICAASSLMCASLV